LPSLDFYVDMFILEFFAIATAIWFYDYILDPSTEFILKKISKLYKRRKKHFLKRQDIT